MIKMLMNLELNKTYNMNCIEGVKLLEEKSVSFDDVFTKAVSFMEAIKAYTNGRDIMCELDGSHIIYKNKFCKDNCVNILNDNYGNGMSAEEILNGEWYIE